jgi:hypothetical protein
MEPSSSSMAPTDFSSSLISDLSKTQTTWLILKCRPNGLKTDFYNVWSLSIFYAVNFCGEKCVLTVVSTVIVVFVGSVPVGGSVSPKLFFG